MKSKESPAAPLRRKRGRGGEPDVSEILRRFKGLLDDGIITQEEFEAKRKQLLGREARERTPSVPKAVPRLRLERGGAFLRGDLPAYP